MEDSTLTKIVLIIVIVAIVVFIFMIFSRVVETSETAARNELAQQQQQMNVKFYIESMDDNLVYVRNAGTDPVTDIAFFVNDIPVDYIGPSSLGPNAVGTYALNDAQLAALGMDSSILRATSGEWTSEMIILVT